MPWHNRRSHRQGHHYAQLYFDWQPLQSLAQLASPLLARKTAHFGTQLSPYPQDSKVMAIADTECQNCLFGLGVVQRLGFTQSDILPGEYTTESSWGNSAVWAILALPCTCQTSRTRYSHYFSLRWSILWRRSLSNQHCKATPDSSAGDNVRPPETIPVRG